MRVRAALALSVTALLGGAMVASAAAAPPPVVTVTHENGGTQIGTGVSGQPLVGVSVDSRGICYGFSYQIGHCVPLNVGK